MSVHLLLKCLWLFILFPSGVIIHFTASDCCSKLQFYMFARKLNSKNYLHAHQHCQSKKNKGSEGNFPISHLHVFQLRLHKHKFRILHTNEFSFRALRLLLDIVIYNALKKSRFIITLNQVIYGSIVLMPFKEKLSLKFLMVIFKIFKLASFCSRLSPRARIFKRISITATLVLIAHEVTILIFSFVKPYQVTQFNH